MRVLTGGKSRRFWVLVGAVVVVLYFLIVNNQAVDTPISRDQVVSSEMSVTVYNKVGNGADVRVEDITLSQENISDIVNWLNATPKSAQILVDRDHAIGSISAGIALNLKYNAEVTIQYDGKHIYITRRSMFHRDTKYILDQENLRGFLENHLKGRFFGEDYPVKDE